ncbi:SCO family protein [Marinimicrobium sp. C2-29]|uniref:SCO family protein n=1 Tax=Marinimicrobium sp. C2-29 TaxID=3139825 RepID=UPI003139362A
MSDSPQSPDQSGPPVDRARQRRGIRRTVAILVSVVAVVVGLQVYKVTRAPALDREALREQGVIVFEQPRNISDFELVTHREEPFTPESLEEQWTLIFFGFTHCPDICPLTMVDLARLMEELPEELEPRTQVLLVTLDPARDDPEVLSDYVPHFHPDFTGVTGEFLTIRRFANEMNVAFSKVTQGDDEDYTVDHSGHIALVNPRGDYHALFKPPFDPAVMAGQYETIVDSFRF